MFDLIASLESAFIPLGTGQPFRDWNLLKKWVDFIFQTGTQYEDSLS